MRGNGHRYCWECRTIATLNQDKGLEHVEIEFYLSSPENWKFDYKTFLEALISTRKLLEEYPSDK